MPTEVAERTSDAVAEVSADTLEPWGRPARGLREYVRAVADRLGCTGDAFWVQTESPVSAYLPLEQRLEGRDVALLWDWRKGWAAEVADERVVARLGGDPLPEPDEVAGFVARVIAGPRIDPKPSRRLPFDVLCGRLADHAPVLVG